MLRLQVNGDPYEIADQATVRDLIQAMDLRVDYVAVEVNAELVPRQQHAGRRLRSGDQVEVVTLVGGG